jgi:hypothetical protein
MNEIYKVSVDIYVEAESPEHAAQGVINELRQSTQTTFAKTLLHSVDVDTTAVWTDVDEKLPRATLEDRIELRRPKLTDGVEVRDPRVVDEVEIPIPVPQETREELRRDGWDID